MNFFEEYRAELYKLAKKIGWQGHGSSMELDQIILSDGLETTDDPDSEEAYWEYRDGFRETWFEAFGAYPE